MPYEYDPPEDDPEYRWLTYPDPYQGREVALDERIAMPDWSRLDEIIEEFPNPNYPNLFKWAKPADGRYRLANWFYCLFERHWSLRGMTNALLDYYEHPEEVHRLFRAMTDFYKAIIIRSAKEQQCDGLWTSDDLGTQTGPFFSVSMFRQFYKPYYKEMIDTAHEHGMTFWMHACGNVEPFIPEWIDIGLDVIHPIQKYTMDEKKIAAEYGSKITVFAGLEVQQVIPWGTPEEVRKEVHFLIDTYWRPGKGRCMITAGNGINGDCPLASLEAFLDESFRYGRKKVSG
jgi:uroporphyrinogen-III decarboxylase